MNWRWTMTKKADFYDSYEEVFVSPKDIKEGESYTEARVLEVKYCLDLHYCSTYKPTSTIEYGIKDDSGNWHIEVEEIDWFNKKLTNDYILVRLTNLYNDKFLNIKLTEDQNNELNLLEKILYTHKVYDIEVTIDHNNSLIAFDDENYWKNKEFYDFLFDELFVYNNEGNVDLIIDDDFEKLKKYKENYLVDVIKDNEQEREID